MEKVNCYGWWVPARMKSMLERVSMDLWKAVRVLVLGYYSNLYCKSCLIRVSFCEFILVISCYLLLVLLLLVSILFLSIE